MDNRKHYQPKIGAMDRRITLQFPTVTKSASGEEVITWTDYRQVWAMVEWRTLVIDEKAIAGFDLPVSTFNFTIWSFKDANSITPKWRVVFDGQEYDIMHVLKDSRERLVLRCELRAAQSSHAPTGNC
jgi:SPP1 family predicted phage head-tail adaptor